MIRTHSEILWTKEQWYTRSRNFRPKQKFSAFGLQFRPPNLKAEHGQKSNFRIMNQNTSLLKKIAGNVQENFEKKNLNKKNSERCHEMC